MVDYLITVGLTVQIRMISNLRNCTVFGFLNTGSGFNTGNIEQDGGYIDAFKSTFIRGTSEEFIQCLACVAVAES